MVCPQCHNPYKIFKSRLKIITIVPLISTCVERAFAKVHSEKKRKKDSSGFNSKTFLRTEISDVRLGDQGYAPPPTCEEFQGAQNPLPGRRSCMELNQNCQYYLKNLRSLMRFSYCLHDVLLFKCMHDRPIWAGLIHACNCIILAFKTAVRWMEIPGELTKQKSRFAGQWVPFICAVSTSDDAALWFKKNRGSDEQLQVIDTKIRLVSNNTFNITNLTNNDRGFYRCKVCGKLEKTILFLEILNGKLALKVTLNLLQKILNFPVLVQYNIYLKCFS